MNSSASRVQRLVRSAAVGLALPSLLASGSASSQELQPFGEIASVAMGGTHTCSLSTIGEVACWGSNYGGQIGDGSFETRVVPTPLAGLSEPLSRIAAGAEHTCALTQSGAVWCWGDNAVFQIGDGSLDDRPLPTPVTGLTGGATSIAAGGQHSCAVTGAGAAQCWGSGYSGQLGDGSMVPSGTPTQVTGLSAGVARVAAGFKHSCALTSAGGLKCWGKNEHGQLGDGTTTDRVTPVDVSGLTSGVEAVSAGFTHTCAIKTDGDLWCWGSGGAVGLGGPAFVDVLVPAAVPDLHNVVSVAAGPSHTCAALQDGTVECWGYNATGQIGNGVQVYDTVLSPVPVSGLSSPAVSVAAGGDNFDDQTCAVLVSGQLSCWGSNRVGQLGDGTTATRFIPAKVAGPPATAVEVGRDHACAANAAGGAVCWGHNRYGQLGDGAAIDQLRPISVATLSTAIAQVSAGGTHSCVVTGLGAAKCWGESFFGQLGYGFTTPSRTPVDVVGLSNGVSAVAAGGDHTCAIAGNAVKCWGRNDSGQLGQGSTSFGEFSPLAVAAAATATSLSAGVRHTCAVIPGGEVKCWGDGVALPTTVATLSSGMVKVSAGDYHTCVLTQAGGVKCWGFNSSGGLGDGTTVSSPVPVDVVGLGSGVAAISAGGTHTCALTVAGGVKCWGENTYGELGDGTTRMRLTPVDVGGMDSGVIALSAGTRTTCALLASNEVRCWGSDRYGEVGDAGRNYSLPGRVRVDSLRADAATQGNAESLEVESDATGRYLVFASSASNLAATADGNGLSDVYRRDLETGSTVRVSVDTMGGELAAASLEPTVSADGQMVAFVTQDAAMNRVHGETSQVRAKRLQATSFGVYLRNILTGTTQRLSLAVPALPGGVGSEPTLAPGGNALVYSGWVSDPAQGSPGPQIIHLPLTRQPGNTPPVIGNARCVSCKAVAANGTESAENAMGQGRNAVLSEDGQSIAWESSAKNALTAVPSTCPLVSTEILLRNLITGSLQRVSAPASPTLCGDPGSTSRNPAMDWSGTRVVYESDQPLLPIDHNSRMDVFLFDGATGQMSRVSESTEAGLGGNGASAEPAISGDGQLIAFRSGAMNLEPSEPDNNETEDVYVRRMDQPQLRRVTRNRRGDQANRSSRRPAMNYNGTRVAFDSEATNLVLDQSTNESLDENDVADVFQTVNPATPGMIFRSRF
jgi:alpha-tubulin suppressor-like RCC1 family protein